MRKFCAGLLLVIISMMAVQKLCNGMPTGAPEEACEKLQPKHKEHKPQPAFTFPYTVTMSADTYSSPSDKITVSLQSTDGMTAFKGFLMAARDETGQPFGSWTKSPAGHELSCSAITHNNNDDKLSVTLTWKPPVDATSGRITITAAVVQNVSTFWVNIPVKMATASRRSSNAEDSLSVSVHSAVKLSGKTATAVNTKSKTPIGKSY